MACEHSRLHVFFQLIGDQTLLFAQQNRTGRPLSQYANYDFYSKSWNATIQGAGIPVDYSRGIHIGNARLSINASRGMGYVVC